MGGALTIAHCSQPPPNALHASYHRHLCTSISSALKRGCHLILEELPVHSILPPQVYCWDGRLGGWHGVAPYVSHGEKERGGDKASDFHAVLVLIAEDGHRAVVALVEGVDGGEEVGGEVLGTGLGIERSLQVTSAVASVLTEDSS